MTLSRRAVIWLVPALLALHNAEEAVTLDRYLPIVRERAPAWARPIVASVTYEQMLVALGIATIVPLGIALWADARPQSAAALWSVLLIQAVVLLNVAAHAFSALVILRGYGPGLATALAINLPFSVYVSRRAAREGWTTRRGLALLAPAAVVVHGPLLIGAIALARAVVR
jgi:hypothetical protein